MKYKGRQKVGEIVMNGTPITPTIRVAEALGVTRHQVMLMVAKAGVPLTKWKARWYVPTQSIPVIARHAKKIRRRPKVKKLEHITTKKPVVTKVKTATLEDFKKKLEVTDIGTMKLSRKEAMQLQIKIDRLDWLMKQVIKELANLPLVGKRFIRYL